MQTTYRVTEVKTVSEIRQCREVVFLLRPHLDEHQWLLWIEEMMQHEKYHVAGIWENGKCVAFAGYRVMTSLHSGRIIYIDDLCTLEAYRSKGLAAQLLKHVKDLAIAGELDAVVLDTDFNNNGAQKVYLKNGFRLAALHLSCALQE